MNRNDGRTAVWVTHKMMATLDADHREDSLLECPDKLTASNAEAAHTSTVTRWTPTNSEGFVARESLTSKAR